MHLDTTPQSYPYWNDRAQTWVDHHLQYTRNKLAKIGMERQKLRLYWISTSRVYPQIHKCKKRYARLSSIDNHHWYRWETDQWPSTSSRAFNVAAITLGRRPTANKRRVTGFLYSIVDILDFGKICVRLLEEYNVWSCYTPDITIPCWVYWYLYLRVLTRSSERRERSHEVLNCFSTRGQSIGSEGKIQSLSKDTTAHTRLYEADAWPIRRMSISSWKSWSWINPNSPCLSSFLRSPTDDPNEERLWWLSRLLVSGSWMPFCEISYQWRDSMLRTARSYWAAIPWSLE